MTEKSLTDSCLHGWHGCCNLSPPMKAISPPASFFPVGSASRHRLLRAVAFVVAASALSGGLFAQTTAPADPNGDRRRRSGGDANAADNAGKGGRGNFDPAAMQERMLGALREQLGVTDDAEWALIAERLAKVSEIRRSAGGATGRGGPPGGGPGGPVGGGNRPTRGPSGNPEQDALRAAITDKLPDAEIKSRLDRLREVRRQNEAKLTRAQEELRAVLSVRQEAVAVMFGLLP